jgi:5-methylcytosine-specific restriction protein A
MNAGHSKIEKQKARELRKSDWWDRRLAEGICYYCRSPVTREKATMDHVVPISRGGKTSRGNVVLACKTCNTKKQDLTAVEWVQYLEAQRSQDFMNQTSTTKKSST